MIKDNQEDNVKLTGEQLKQIEVVQLRLANLQNEIFIAGKILSETKALCIRENKEKEYQTELLTDLISKISSKKSEYENLLRMIPETQTILDKIKKDTREIDLNNNAKKIELDEMEIFLTRKENSLLKKEEDLKSKQTKTEEDRKLLELAKNAFKKAVESVTW